MPSDAVATHEEASGQSGAGQFQNGRPLAPRQPGLRDITRIGRDQSHLMTTVMQDTTEIHDGPRWAAILEIDSMHVLGDSQDIDLSCRYTCTE